MEQDDHPNQIPSCSVRLVNYQRDVAFPNAYSVTSPTVTQVEKIRTIRSQSMCFFSVLLSVRTENRAFRANLRIGVPEMTFAQSIANVRERR